MTTQKWWNETKANVADALWAHFGAVEKQQAPRGKSMMKCLELYNGKERKPGQAHILTPGGEVLSLNVVASIQRALRAKITKSRPRPWLVTDGAKQKLQERAKGMQQFITGVLYEQNAYVTGERCFDLAGIANEGWAVVYDDAERERVCVERAYPWEVFIDDLDGYYDSPLSYYRVRPIDREKVLAMFPDLTRGEKEAVLRAPAWKGFPDFGFDAGGADCIKVVEGWRLALGKKNPGRHVIAIKGAKLLDREWTRDRCPLKRLRLEPEPVGCHGTGVVEELMGIQLEINEVAASIQEGNRKGGTVIICLEAGSKVNKEKITNAMVSTLDYTGTQPVPIIIPAVAQEKYNYLWALVSRAYEILGISQLTAQSQKPAGIDSGKGLRTFHEIESERFSYVVRAYEQFFLDIATGIIDAAQDLAEQVPGFSARYQESNSIRRIKWSEVKMSDDAYVMQLYPANALRDDPAGRMSDVKDMLGLGVIDAREARMYFDFPDLSSRVDHYESSYKLALWQIDKILVEGEPKDPESYQHLPTALRLALGKYNDARRLGDVPAENMELLRTYIDTCRDRILGQEFQALEQALAGAPPPPPAGAPGTAPPVAA